MFCWVHVGASFQTIEGGAAMLAINFGFRCRPHIRRGGCILEPDAQTTNIYVCGA
jgi:hypothetical protein